MKNLIIPLVLTALLASCSGRNARSLYDEGRMAEDSGKFQVAAERYDALVKEYPTEAVAETAMYRLVMIRSNTPGDKTLAAESDRRYLELYPKSPGAAKVMFMLAFLYNNEMRQTDSAKKYYELFLATYPTHELAPSAKFELETLGKPAEELLGDGPGPAAKEPKAGKGSRP